METEMFEDLIPLTEKLLRLQINLNGSENNQKILSTYEIMSRAYLKRNEL